MNVWQILWNLLEIRVVELFLLVERTVEPKEIKEQSTNGNAKCLHSGHPLLIGVVCITTVTI